MFSKHLQQSSCPAKSAGRVAIQLERSCDCS
jgi:hypothetical protein